MTLWQIVYEAARSLGAHRLRTALSMLGIVIGISSVTLMFAIGYSVRTLVGQQLEMLGNNLLIVSPNANRSAGQLRSGTTAVLTLSDVEAMKSASSISAVAPILQGRFSVAFLGGSLDASVSGTTPEMFALRGWKLSAGTLFGAQEMQSQARVAVIGKRLAESLFYKRDPIYQPIRIDNVQFLVTGVLASTGRSFDGAELEDAIFVPIDMARSYLIRPQRADTVHYAVVQARGSQFLKVAEEEIKSILREKHRLREFEDDDFQVSNLANLADSANLITAAFAFMLGTIGSISLLVGGIGIMNIMLVSVTERTKEIGIRRALGARRVDVLLQFLIEALLICLVGAVGGVLLSFTIALGISESSGFTVAVDFGSVVLAAFFASLVGIFFGYYPARRAARLMPAECLRAD